MKKSKRVFDSTFKEKLICKGCGFVFVRWHPSFNQCPRCICCHALSLESVLVRGRIWMRCEVDVMHEVWRKVGVVPCFPARRVKDEIITFCEKVKQK